MACSVYHNKFQAIILVKKKMYKGMLAELRIIRIRVLLQLCYQQVMPPEKKLLNHHSPYMVN